MSKKKPKRIHPDAKRACGGWLDIADYCGKCDRCRRELMPRDDRGIVIGKQGQPKIQGW